MRIRLVMLGKTRRPEIRALIDDYLHRISRFTPAESVELRDGRGLARLKAEPSAVWILLDAAGREMDSIEFARWMGGVRDRGTREVIFLCGDAEGFPAEWRTRAQQRLSLSRLTFSHELARAALAEQIYRALATLAGHPYPK